jgi:predicted outer membrane repeat protein
VTVSTLTFTNVAFEENVSAGSGGGAVLIQAGHPNFQNCTFVHNTTTEDGGAIRLIMTAAKGRFDACTFTKNTAGVDGGAIYFSSSLATTVVLTNCIFTGNSAPDGGAVMIKTATSGFTKFLFCDFVGNAATAVSPACGGIRFGDASSNCVVLNSIFANNTPLDYDVTRKATSQINYSIVMNPVITGTNMWKDDPGFVNPSDPWDLHLTASSTGALDRGAVTTTDADLKPILIDANAKDMDGNARSSGLLPDLGAYELPQAPVVKPKFIRGLCRAPSVAVDSGTPNIGDVLYLLRWKIGAVYAEPGCIAACDVNDDNKVDITDATALLGYLFLGQTAPKAPFGATAPGEDPTPSVDMTCVKGMAGGG